VLGAVIVLGIGVAAFTVLLWRYGGLDAIRTASAITVAAGGAAALLLVARRQRSTELTLEHQREVALAAERDAAEQRITELYAHAVDQLGAEKAPVRLGGLHALERLAQNNPVQRQTIIDVICAYLRMPYTPRMIKRRVGRPPRTRTPRYEERRQELQVRLTAQRILSAHLRPEAAEVFWDNIDLDLTEAHLHQLDLSACHVRRAQFDGATFDGNTMFYRTEFAGNAGFERATFAGDVEFDWATFTWYAQFGEATFVGTAGFLGVEFVTYSWFRGATFAATAEFYDAKFTQYAEFRGAEFAGDALFGEAKFAAKKEFDDARVARARRVTLPTGWITRAAQPVEGEEEGWLYVVRDEDSSEQPAEAQGEGEVRAGSETGK